VVGSLARDRPELKGKVSIVRELHVYGSVVPVSARDPSKFQHQGYGTLLMEEAVSAHHFDQFCPASHHFDHCCPAFHPFTIYQQPLLHCARALANTHSLCKTAHNLYTAHCTARSLCG
jgi:hypothetical protein